MRGALGACLALAAVAACAAPAADEGGEASGALRPAERTLVGRAAPYPADATLAAREPELHRSIAARRQAAWDIVARVLAPVAVPASTRTVPLFRTWYGKDDVERMFGRLRGTLAPDAIAAHRAPPSGAIEDAFAWNASFAGAWTDEDLAARLATMKDGADVQGLAGNARVAYSPGLVGHLFRRWADVDACQKRPAPEADVPREAPNASCFGEETPIDAALVKASWWRADAPLPVHDTSASALTARRTGTRDEGGWGVAERQASPGPDSIYTVRMSEGASFRLSALHVVTKELRDWVWITLWWSDRLDEGFGQDRPDAIRRLGGPWSHYAMSVVTAYDEGDPDPRGGQKGSLGDALAAVHEGRGGPTWTSNPYLERGAHNAQTNCIGCHQHGGVRGVTSERVLADEAAFPAAGRTRVRKNFPADYLFALESAPERLARIVQTP